MGPNDPEEIKANDFASSFLIPHVYNSCLCQLKSKEKVIAFAKQLGIHPGIIVGRLQHEGIIGYREMNSLRIHYDWKE